MKRIWLLAILTILFCMSQTAMAIRPVAIGDVVHKGGGVFDVRAYGATGDGSTDDYAAINSAATAAAGNTLEFKSGTYVVGTNITLDEDAVFYKGATVKPDSGIVITLTGAVTAGPYQIFDESSGGTVTISNGMANEVLPQWWNGAVIQSFTDTDATPSVKKGRMFATANTVGTTITMFDDGISGQVIRVFIGDANTTLDFSGTNLKGNGGVDWVAADGDALIAGFDGTDWYCMISTPAGTVTTADKDLVSGTGMTGGEDDVLVGPDSDLTLNVVAGDGVIANPDEIEVFGFVASDGTPNDAAVTDAAGMVTFNYDTTHAGTDPASIFDGSTAGDTDFWMGITADEVGDDNDIFQIGTGTTKGASPHFSMIQNGYIALGVAHTPVDGLSIYPDNNNGISIYESDATISGNIALALNATLTSGTFGMYQAGVLRNAFQTASNSWMNDGNGMNLGLNTTGPDRKLDVLDTSDPQIRMTHTDGTVYTDLQTDGSGDLAVLPSGDKITLSVGTKHDGFVIRNPAEVQTLDAVQTTLDNITLLDENTYHVEAWVIGVQSDGTDRASYHIAATVYRTAAGAATLQGTVTSFHTQESNASLDATITVNVNDARVSVTGIGGETWEWGCNLKYMNMSN